MSYSKRKFAIDLKNQLKLSYNPKKIGSWAHEMYLRYCNQIDRELEEIIIDLFVQEEGPEFELTIDELSKLANKLTEDGEKEELAKAIPEIKDIAIKTKGNWLTCPLCQEEWESCSEYAVVFCPKCEHKLHNPTLLKS